MKYAQKQEYVLAVLFILFLLIDVYPPPFLAGYIDTFAGNAIVWGVALSMFGCCNMPLAMLGLFVAYVFLERSKRDHYVPSETSKSTDFSKYNDFPFTLEEEVISSVPTILDGSGPVSNDTMYHPIMAPLL